MSNNSTIPTIPQSLDAVADISAETRTILLSAQWYAESAGIVHYVSYTPSAAYGGDRYIIMRDRPRNIGVSAHYYTCAPSGVITRTDMHYSAAVADITRDIVRPAVALAPACAVSAPVAPETETAAPSETETDAAQVPAWSRIPDAVAAPETPFLCVYSAELRTRIETIIKSLGGAPDAETDAGRRAWYIRETANSIYWVFATARDNRCAHEKIAPLSLGQLHDLCIALADAGISMPSAVARWLNTESATVADVLSPAAPETAPAAQDAPETETAETETAPETETASAAYMRARAVAYAPPSGLICDECDGTIRDGALYYASRLGGVQCESCVALYMFIATERERAAAAGAQVPGETVAAPETETETQETAAAPARRPSRRGHLRPAARPSRRTAAPETAQETAAATDPRDAAATAAPSETETETETETDSPLLSRRDYAHILHQQKWYAQYRNRRVAYWHLDCMDADGVRDDSNYVDSRVLDRLSRLGLFRRESGGPATYGHIDYYITDAGLAVSGAADAVAPSLVPPDVSDAVAAAIAAGQYWQVRDRDRGERYTCAHETVADAVAGYTESCELFGGAPSEIVKVYLALAPDSWEYYGEYYAADGVAWSLSEHNRRTAPETAPETAETVAPSETETETETAAPADAPAPRILSALAVSVSAPETETVRETQETETAPAAPDAAQVPVYGDGATETEPDAPADAETRYIAIKPTSGDYLGFSARVVIETPVYHLVALDAADVPWQLGRLMSGLACYCSDVWTNQETATAALAWSLDKYNRDAAAALAAETVAAPADAPAQVPGETETAPAAPETETAQETPDAVAVSAYNTAITRAAAAILRAETAPAAPETETAAPSETETDAAQVPVYGDGATETETAETETETETDAAAAGAQVPIYAADSSVSVDSGMLAAALKLLKAAVCKKTTLPVLQNVLMHASGDVLELSATNLELGITARIPLLGDYAPLAITVPYDLAVNSVPAAPGMSVSLNLNARKNELTIVRGAMSAKLKGLPAEEYPITPDLTSAPPIAIMPAHLLTDIITAVKHSASKDNARPVLAGLYMHFDMAPAPAGTGAGMLDVAAADGFRLARVAVSDAAAGVSVLTPCKLIIPAPSAVALAALKLGGTVSLYRDYSGNQLTITGESGGRGRDSFEIVLTTRLVEGNYVDINRVIPVDFTTRTIVDRRELLAALKSIKAVAKDSANIARFNVADAETDGGAGVLTISATAAELGETAIPLSASIYGESPANIALNVQFCIDAVAAIDSASVSIETKTPGSPAVIRPSGLNTPDYVYTQVLMPMYLANR